MPSSTTKSVFWRGVRDGAPFVLVIGPFGMLFGVVGTEAGLNIAEVMGFSFLVIAGAAQFTAVQLMVENVPTLVVLATALAVNMRMAMYSASLTPWLGKAPFWQRAFAAYGLVDQSYAVSIAKFEAEPQMRPVERIRYFLGSFFVLTPFWFGLTFLGAKLGKAIPPEFALDFAMPVTFLALIAPALRTLPHVIAALVSTVMALVLAGLPYSLGLIVAAILAMLAGALSETLLERRA